VRRHCFEETGRMIRERKEAVQGQADDAYHPIRCAAALF
jgi:hypothetical protein